VEPILLGAIAGAACSVSTSYLITGRIFHRYQAATPQTWRRESGRQHGAAIALQALAGAAIGWLFTLAGSPEAGPKPCELGLGIWLIAAAILLIQAIYVRWHPAFVLGLLLDWFVFVAGVLAACNWLSSMG
jgi:hypothetical protein